MPPPWGSVFMNRSLSRIFGKFLSTLILFIAESQIMKKLIAVIPLLLFCSAWASEDCKNLAQNYVEIREDYKSLAALTADLMIARARLGGLSGENYAIQNGRINMMEISGQIVFNHMGGAKGDKLYKRAYIECVSEEKANADIKAKLEARAKAREAANITKEIQ
jgi:hypothetical protein